MRTTLTIDDDVLSAAREIADRGHTSIGVVVSALARRALTTPQTEGTATGRHSAVSHGFVPIPSRGGIVTSELVAELLNEGE